VKKFQEIRVIGGIGGIEVETCAWNFITADLADFADSPRLRKASEL
jgi:hypothetical protein